MTSLADLDHPSRAYLERCGFRVDPQDSKAVKKFTADFEGRFQLRLGARTVRRLLMDVQQARNGSKNRGRTRTVRIPLGCRKH